MLVATFGQSTGWAGKTITWEDERFLLEEVGQVTAADVMRYDAEGQIAWEREELRDWVQLVADFDAASAAAAPPSEPVAVTLEQLQSAVLPVSGWRKTLRITGRIACIVGALIAGINALGALPDGTWMVGLVSALACVAMIVGASRLWRLPREAPHGIGWLKIATSAVFVASAGIYVGSSGLWMFAPAANEGGAATANAVIFWSLVGVLMAWAVLAHDQQAVASPSSSDGMTWRPRWPTWLWAPFAVVFLMGADAPGGVLFFGIIAAYLGVWSLRRCVGDDGVRIGWPGRGGPAVAGVIAAIIGFFVIAGVFGQYNTVITRVAAANDRAGSASMFSSLLSEAEYSGDTADLSGPVSTATYAQDGIRVEYEQPTLKAVDPADIPYSLSASGSVLIDPISPDVISTVGIVPAGKDPSALVMVMSSSTPPDWLDQVQGLSKKQFARLALADFEDGIRQAMAAKIDSASAEMTITDWDLTSGMINGMPSVSATIYAEDAGQPVDAQMRFVFTRRNLYMVMYAAEPEATRAQKTALQAAYDSVRIKW